MKLNCRPGDLALVIYDEPDCARNIGRFVRIKGPLARNPYYQLPCWLIHPVSSAQYYVCLDDVDAGARGACITGEDRIDHPDAWLMPVRSEDERFTVEMERLVQTAGRFAIEGAAAENSGSLGSTCCNEFPPFAQAGELQC